MIALDQLAALDVSLWLGSGKAAASALHVNQSTISRHVQLVLKELELEVDRRPPFCRLLGDLDLLQAERSVHQMARLKGRAALRLDGPWATSPWFLGQLTPGWIIGRPELPGVQRPLELLSNRMIDAWVGSRHPDLPAANDPHWWVMGLEALPRQPDGHGGALVVRRDLIAHGPLQRLARALQPQAGRLAMDLASAAQQETRRPDGARPAPGAA